MLISSAADFVLEHVESLTIRKAAGLLALVFVFVVFINGIALVPPEHYQRLSENPFTTRKDLGDPNYIQETVLLPVIAFYTGLTSRLTFNLLCAGTILGAYLLFALLVFRREGQVRGLLITTTLVTSPLTTVLLSWLGMPDGLTVALTVPFMFASSAWLMFVLAVLGTMNHIVFAFAAGEIVVLRFIGHDGTNRRHLVSVVLGVAVGYACVQAFLAFNHIQVISRWALIWMSGNDAAFPMTLYSLFNVQWVVVLVCLVICFRMDKRYYAYLSGILVLNYAITLMTLDKTRIFSLLSWGVLVECIFHASKLTLNQNGIDLSNQKQLLQALLVTCVISLIAPRYYSWNGEILAAPFYESLKHLIAFLGGVTRWR